MFLLTLRLGYVAPLDLQTAPGKILLDGCHHFDHPSITVATNDDASSMAFSLLLLRYGIWAVDGAKLPNFRG